MTELEILGIVFVWVTALVVLSLLINLPPEGRTKIVSVLRHLKMMRVIYFLLIVAASTVVQHYVSMIWTQPNHVAVKPEPSPTPSLDERRDVAGKDFCDKKGWGFDGVDRRDGHDVFPTNDVEFVFCTMGDGTANEYQIGLNHGH